MTSVEYEDIYNLTMDDNIHNNDDEYNKLINKESVVLDTLNRIVDQKEEEKSKKSMLEAPINIVVYKVFKTVEMVCKEMYKRKPIHLIFNKERQLYIGMFIVFCSVCFIILYKGS